MSIHQRNWKKMLVSLIFYVPYISYSSVPKDYSLALSTKRSKNFTCSISITHLIPKVARYFCTTKELDYCQSNILGELHEGI